MWIKLAQLLLGLSILIILHEAGHFIPAKLFKTRVEKFFLFFDAWGKKLFSFKYKGTEYGIGWLPLGGYVKISGMVDESMDKEAMAEPPKDWEFRSKPAWQRLIILTGGVLVNFILAYLIFAGVLFYYGEDYLANKDLKWGVWTNEAGTEMGIKNGDKVVSVNGLKIDNYREAAQEITLGKDGILTVDRNGELVELPITQAAINKLVETRGYASLVAPRLPYIVGGFSDTSVAKIAGLQVDDSLVAINGKQALFFDEYLAEIPTHKNQEITLTAYRNGTPVDITMRVPNHGKIGVAPYGDMNRFYKLEHKEYSLGEALVGAAGSTWDRLSAYVRQFKLIFDFESGAYKEVGGFKTIMDQYSPTWDWQRFWEFTAFLSLMLGFLNILPIPALDGGHVLFVLVEMISGRKPSTKFLEYAQMVGFFLLLALLIFANGQDVLRAFGG